MADTDVVQRLRTVLKRTGWTPYELSTRAGLSGSHIANILQRGAKRLGADTLRAVAQASGVSERWMILGEGTPDSDDRTSRPENLSATWSAIPGWTDAETLMLLVPRRVLRRRAVELRGDAWGPGWAVDLRVAAAQMAAKSG